MKLPNEGGNVIAVRFRKLLPAALCLALCAWGPVPAPAADAVRAGILISSRMSPYLEVAEGVADTLKQARNIPCATYHLDKLPRDRMAALAATIAKERYSLVVAIGAEAARFAGSFPGDPTAARVYAMLRDPQKVLGPGVRPCGVSLDIPVAEQLSAIHRAHPAARRIGMLFNPARNRGLLKAAAGAAEGLGLTILPLAVASKPEIPKVLEKSWRRMDALWFIPDATTVLSKRLVEHVIRQSIYRKVPVIGYQRFFYESGAALVFVVDYREVGAQCAREGLRMLAGGECRQAAPAFRLWVNTRVMGKLGAAFPQRMTAPLQKGP